MKKFAISTLSFLMLTGVYIDPILATDLTRFTKSSQYSLGESDLGDALVDLANMNGLQLVVSSQLTQGRRTAGIHGNYSLDEALTELLSGSGLGYTILPEVKVIRIYPLPRATKNNIGAVNIQGAFETQNTGINGSKDVTATEGSKSYGTTDISIGGKSHQSLKEVTQSVSVLTNQQLNDQNINNLDMAMKMLPGITTTQSGSSQQSYYSRGWQIGSVSVDGSPPFSIVNSNFSDKTSSRSDFDISMYDHVELLRGSDSLNSLGSSNPSGTINLVRKRPLDHYQATVQTNVGSWSNYRTSLDVTGPLGIENKLRGRAVVTGQNNEYFYDTASKKKRLFYGVLEYDLTSDTVVRVGASNETTEGVPWVYGLPRYEDASNPSLKRSTSYALPWSNFKVDTENQFLQIDHTFRENWSLSGLINRQSQNQFSYTGALYGPLSLSGKQSQYVLSSGSKMGSTLWLGNLNLDGRFNVFSLPQHISLGGSYSRSNYQGRTDSAQNTFSVDKALLDRPEPVWRRGRSVTSEFIQSSVIGKIDSVFLSFLPALHFQSALRWDEFEYINGSNAKWNNKQIRYSIPAYGFRYDLTDAISIYASHSDIYQFQPFYPTSDNKQLPPMTGNTREVGVKYFKGSLNASLAFYKSERENMSNPDWNAQTCGPDNNEFCYITGGSESSKGVDLEISGEPRPWWSINLGYTFNINTKTSVYQEKLPLSTFTPRHQLKLWNNFNLSGNEWLRKMQFGLGMVSQTKTSAVSQICNSSTLQCNSLVADQHFYSIFSSRLDYKFDKNWSTAFNINNIFDRTYYSSLGTRDSGNWYGEPRNFTISLEGKF